MHFDAAIKTIFRGCLHRAVGYTLEPCIDRVPRIWLSLGRAVVLMGLHAPTSVHDSVVSRRCVLVCNSMTSDAIDLFKPHSTLTFLVEGALEQRCIEQGLQAV